MTDARYINLQEAARLCPGKPAPSTVWRWCRRGVRARSGERIRLSHVRVGGRIYTTLHSLTGFFEATAKADTAYFDRSVAPREINHSVSSQRSKDLERARAICEDAGI